MGFGFRARSLDRVLRLEFGDLGRDRICKGAVTGPLSKGGALRDPMDIVGSQGDLGLLLLVLV